jgi:PAS domain S-box-containing protein
MFAAAGRQEIVVHQPETRANAEPTGSVGIEVAVLDDRGVIVAVNGPWTDFCEENDGNPARTGVGVDYLDVCHRAGDEPGAREVADAIQAALNGDGPSANRVHISCHAPHEKRWFDVLISSRTDETGNVIGATVMLARVPEDRTDPIEADPTLAFEILEACPDALLVAGEDGLIQSVNQPAERLFGCSRTELLGRTINTVLSGRLLETTSSSLQLRAVRPDGWEIPVEVGLSLRDVKGEPRLIAAVRDISERLRAERRTQLIHRSIDAVSDAILVFDEDSFRFLHANTGAVDMFGYRRSELVGNMSPTDLITDLPFAELASAIGSLREKPDDHVRLSTSAQAKDGSQFAVEIQLNWPVPASPNAPRPVVAVIRDLRGTTIR